MAIHIFNFSRMNVSNSVKTGDPQNQWLDERGTYPATDPESCALLKIAPADTRVYRMLHRLSIAWFSMLSLV
jgi:hypothetical protein